MNDQSINQSSNDDDDEYQVIAFTLGFTAIINNKKNIFVLIFNLTYRRMITSIV